MAEGLAKRLWPHAQIKSAGSKPSVLNPHAVTVLKELGIDISNQYSKSVHDLPSDFLVDLDFIITLCAEEVCPVFPTKAKKLHWPFTDPVVHHAVSEAEQLQRFRNVRDNIYFKLKEFKKIL